MTETGPASRVREDLTGVTAVLVTGVWLVALVAGQDWWLPAMLFGYIVVVPLVGLLSGEKEAMREWGNEEPTDDTTRRNDRDAHRKDEALSTLRERYARGELTDEQFERKLDQLLETETLEDLEDQRSEMTNRRNS